MAVAGLESTIVWMALDEDSRVAFLSVTSWDLSLVICHIYDIYI